MADLLYSFETHAPDATPEEKQFLLTEMAKEIAISPEMSGAIANCKQFLSHYKANLQNEILHSISVSSDIIDYFLPINSKEEFNNFLKTLFGSDMGLSHGKKGEGVLTFLIFKKVFKESSINNLLSGYFNEVGQRLLARNILNFGAKND